MSRHSFPLPDELTLEILSYLPGRSLFRLSRVSRYFYNLTFTRSLHYPHIGAYLDQNVSNAALRQRHLSLHRNISRHQHEARKQGNSVHACDLPRFAKWAPHFGHVYVVVTWRNWDGSLPHHWGGGTDVFNGMAMIGVEQIVVGEYFVWPVVVKVGERGITMWW